VKVASWVLSRSSMVSFMSLILSPPSAAARKA